MNLDCFCLCLPTHHKDNRDVTMTHIFLNAKNVEQDFKVKKVGVDISKGFDTVN